MVYHESVVSCDCLYGRDGQFRAELDAEQILYMADIPLDTQVYLKSPVVGIPEKKPGARGRPCSVPVVLSADKPVAVHTLLTKVPSLLQSIKIRHTERGLLTYKCAARRVFSINPSGQVREEWLFIRQEFNGKYTFSLSNAPLTMPLECLALWRCQRPEC